MISKRGLTAFKVLWQTPDQFRAAEAIPILASVALVCAAVLAISVVAPRLTVKAHKRKGLIFWQDICVYPDAAEYSVAVQQLSADDAAEHIRSDCYTLAHICDRKYKRVMWAIWIGAFGFGLTILALLFAR